MFLALSVTGAVALLLSTEPPDQHRLVELALAFFIGVTVGMFLRDVAVPRLACWLEAREQADDRHP